MDLKLKPFDFAQAAARAGMSDVAERVSGGSKMPTGFQQAFTEALTQVSNTQNQATQLQREVQFGNPDVSLEQTMIAMQKAQIGFQSAVQVRNRLVQAYTDIMNMQV